MNYEGSQLEKITGPPSQRQREPCPGGCRRYPLYTLCGDLRSPGATERAAAQRSIRTMPRWHDDDDNVMLVENHEFVVLSFLFNVSAMSDPLEILSARSP